MSASVAFIDFNGVSLITLESLPDITAGNNGVPRKVGFRNTSNRVLNSVLAKLAQVGTNDGSALLRMRADSASVQPTIGAPYGFAAVNVGGATGAWGATGTYGYKITATKTSPAGESGPSQEITAVVALTTDRITLSWTQDPNADGYLIYRTPTPGTYGASTLLTTIGSGATVTFNDDGAATSTGTPPSTNTTGGWLVVPTLSGAGAGGVWAGTGFEFYRVVALDATGVEIANSLEASINVDDTTKKVTLNWAAVAAAASFKVYRSTSSGVYTSPALRATLGSGSTSYVDDGSVTTTGALTTNPSYGIPPTTFASTDLSVGNMAIGQEFYLWLIENVPLGTPEVGNPRQASLSVVES
jgi:hypothetical protein